MSGVAILASKRDLFAIRQPMPHGRFNNVKPTRASATKQTTAPVTTETTKSPMVNVVNSNVPSVRERSASSASCIRQL